jgi:hypothetical protein
MPDFADNTDDTARLNFLYERIYQRPPDAQETELGLEFVNQTPIHEDNPAAANAAADPPPRRKAFKGQGPLASRDGFAGNGRRRAPLTSWEEYAQALLQANETSFVN